LLPPVAGARLGCARRLLPARLAGPLGHDPSPAPPALGPASRSAQPRRKLVLGPCRLAPGRESSVEQGGNLRALCPRYLAGSVLFAPGAWPCLGVDLCGARGVLLPDRSGRRLGNERILPGGCPLW